MNPVERLRSVGDRLTPSVEALAQAVAERAVELVLSALDMNALLDRVDLNAVLDQVDVNGLLARVDVNAVLDEADIDALLTRVDLNAVLDRVDLARLLARVDLNGLAARLDLDRLLATVDVNRLMATVDVTAIVQQVNLNQVMEQVDVDEVIKKVDLDAVMGRVDMNAIVQRVDVDALVEQTDLAAVIARSSGGIAGNALDVARSQTVGLDEFFARWVARFRHRRYAGPPALPDGRQSETGAEPRIEEAPPPVTPMVTQKTLLGKCSGFASRFVAFVVDEGAATGIFALALASISFAASVLTGNSIHWNRGDIWLSLAFIGWQFIYFAYSWAASGKTFGMAVFGVRVVRDDGSDASWRQAVVRTLALPLSFLLLGLGFLGILLGDRRRALHDVIARTAVVYSWDARAARLRFLSRS